MQLAQNIRIILLENLVKAQTKNPKYSMRSYARRIGISQAAISEILAGKRPVTKKSAAKILSALDQSPEEISRIMDSEGESKSPYRSIDMDAYHLISDWHHYAILSLAHTEDFISEPASIAKRLGISEKAASDAVVLLLRLNLLKKSKSGTLKPTDTRVEAISPVANPALRKANRKNLELAQNALDQVPFELRDFTAITLCFDPDRIEDARKMIKNFRRNFDRVMESGRKKEVYKLCVQLFPLSKWGNL